MTEKTPQEYIIGLAKRYKEGKVSKVMFPKYLEFAFDWFSFEASNLKGMECVFYTISFGMSSVQAVTISAQPKLKKPLPKFQSGGIHGEQEMIVNSKGKSILHAHTPDRIITGNYTASFDCITPKINGEIISYRCGHCSRVFEQKVPHKCNGMYRKKNMNFIPMY